MYKAEGPTIEARNADATPEPLPTSTHTPGLESTRRHTGHVHVSQRKYVRKSKNTYIYIYVCVCVCEHCLTSSAAASLRLSPARPAGGRSPPPARTHLGNVLARRASGQVWGYLSACSAPLVPGTSGCAFTPRSASLTRRCRYFSVKDAN